MQSRWLESHAPRGKARFCRTWFRNKRHIVSPATTVNVSHGISNAGQKHGSRDLSLYPPRDSHIQDQPLLEGIEGGGKELRASRKAILGRCHT